MRRSPAPALLPVLLALPLLLGGCTGGSDQAASSAETASDSAGGSGGLGEAAPDMGAADGGAPEGGATGAGGGGSAAAPPAAPALGRVAPGPALVRTAELTVEVPDVGDAADRAGRLAASAGGTVEAEERSAGSRDGTASGSALVVLRVPPREFDPVLQRLAALGDEVDRRVGTQDVTDQVVDLDSRIATQRASVARVRALLGEADDLGEVVQIEGELTRRTADLESLEARLAALEEQVDLSTITLRLHDTDGAAAGGPGGFSDGLEAGWRALTALALAAGLTVGALLPFVPLLLLAGGALLWRSRSRRAAA